MNLITVGMGELCVCDDPRSVLITHALGSCIAVMVHDRVRLVGGMIHYMLPLAAVTADTSRRRPAMFADTGIPLLLEGMYALGCQPEDLVVKVAGGARIQDEGGYFAIGKRNYVALRRIVWQAGLQVSAEAVGGRVSRTVRLFVGDGRAMLRTSDQYGEIDL